MSHSLPCIICLLLCVAVAVVGSVSRLNRLMSPSFGAPQLGHSGCLGRNELDRQPTNGDTRVSAMHRVDVNRFFVARKRPYESRRGSVDEGSNAVDDDPPAADYIRLDVLRVVLAVVDLFVVVHRCACLGYWHSEGQVVAVSRPGGGETMRNGAAGGGIALCPKHDGGNRAPSE